MSEWLIGARLRTLPAAVVPVLVGTAATFTSWSDLRPWHALAALIVAVALQVGVNFANDYSDGVRGTDDDRVGPVRLVGSGRKSPAAVKQAAQLSFGVAGVVGVVLSLATAWWLLLVGAASICAGWYYTGGKKPYGYRGLGEVFVFVFFGLVATLGSDFVQRDAISGTACLLAIPVGLLATALLVINNLRDIPGDTASGKRTLAVRLGDVRTRLLYQVMLAVSFLLLVPASVMRPAVALGFVALPLAVAPVRIVRSSGRGAALIPVLGATGRLQLAFGLLVTIGLLITPA